MIAFLCCEYASVELVSFLSPTILYFINIFFSPLRFFFHILSSFNHGILLRIFFGFGLSRAKRRPHWWIHQFLCDCSLLIATRTHAHFVMLWIDLSVQMHTRTKRARTRTPTHRQFVCLFHFYALTIVLGCFFGVKWLLNLCTALRFHIFFSVELVHLFLDWSFCLHG